MGLIQENAALLFGEFFDFSSVWLSGVVLRLKISAFSTNWRCDRFSDDLQLVTGKRTGGIRGGVEGEKNFRESRFVMMEKHYFIRITIVKYLLRISINIAR